MPDDPLGVDVPTPGPGSRQAAPPGHDELARIRGYLDELARCGPRLVDAPAIVRADAVAGFVSGRQGELAAAGLPVDRRAELILCAAALRCAVAERRWARVRVACTRIAAMIEACDPAVQAPPCFAGAPDAAAPEPRWPWSSRNTEGITLGEAVAAARARQSMRGEFDAPAG
jgi:hypothetical protein